MSSAGVTQAWSSANRILCVRLDALGDVLMTGPAIRALKLARPGRRITLLTSSAGAAGAALLPEVDEVAVYDPPWMKATPPRVDSREEFATIETLRSRRFDAAVVFTVFSQNPLPAALLCHLAGIPLRLAHCRENPYQLLTDWVLETEPGASVRHEVRRQLDLVAAVGASLEDERMRIRLPNSAREQARSRLARHGVGETDPWVLIHPGASAPSRRYAPERFSEVARRLSKEHGLTVVFTGSPGEVGLVESIRGAMDGPSLSLAGALDLGVLAALIGTAPVLISNNTGPVHLAASLGTPVVDLYALTNPQHTPWGVPHRVLFHDVPCRYCYRSVCPERHHRCLALVPPGAVVEAALDLLAEARAGAGASGDGRSYQEPLSWTPSESTPRTTTPPPASSATVE